MDTNEQKAEQRANWNAVAAGWDKWWTTFERAAQKVSDRLVDLADVRSGDTVLDLATGIGEPALTAARRVGPEGRVVATDQALEMLRLGRARGEAARLDNVEFREMDAEVPAFSEGTFDALLCRWGLMFVPDISGALGRLRLLLRDDGKFATAAWGPAEDVPMIGLAGPILRDKLNLEVPPPDALGPFRFAEPGHLEAEFKKAGFSDVAGERFTITYEFDTVDAYAQFRQDISLQTRELVERFPPEQLRDAFDAVKDAARNYARPDGRVFMDNTVICVAGRC